MTTLIIVLHRLIVWFNLSIVSSHARSNAKAKTAYNHYSKAGHTANEKIKESIIQIFNPCDYTSNEVVLSALNPILKSIFSVGSSFCCYHNTDNKLFLDIHFIFCTDYWLFSIKNILGIMIHVITTLSQAYCNIIIYLWKLYIIRSISKCKFGCFYIVIACIIFFQTLRILHSFIWNYLFICFSLHLKGWTWCSAQFIGYLRTIVIELSAHLIKSFRAFILWRCLTIFWFFIIAACYHLRIW